MSNKLQCAVIGLGIGEQHARALLTHPSVKLAAICDLNQEKLIEVIKKYQLQPNIIKNFSDILMDKNINLVSIASFDDNHFEQIMACLEHGKHVFVEKPLCQTPAQLQKIHALWKKTDLALSSNLILRKAPLYLWLDNIIASGKLGKIYAADMDYLYGRVHKITEGWRSTVENYSVMAGGGIHMLDLLIRFVGNKPKQVQSSVNKITTQGTPFRYHDFHAATFYFDEDIIGRVTSNFGCTHKHQHVVRLFGTKATFIYDDMGARIHWNRDENEKAEYITLAPKPIDKGALLLDFVEAILANQYKKRAEIEFDLMAAIAASDHAVAHHHYPIDIAYLT